jgi:hypothetical protein
VGSSPSIGSIKKRFRKLGRFCFLQGVKVLNISLLDFKIQNPKSILFLQVPVGFLQVLDFGILTSKNAITQFKKFTIYREFF